MDANDTWEPHMGKLTERQYFAYLSLATDVLLHESILRFNIDKALDSGDKEAFEKYTAELNKLAPPAEVKIREAY